ncbi:MAG: hypothetical protein QXI58_03530, partial [Candidatus Micrarchaeia archaeon]
ENEDIEKCGELIKIQNKFKDEKLNIYQPRVINGKIYISVLGTLKRINEIYEENTNKSVRTTITCFPYFK